ncbi:MAG: AAA family ATPase [Spirochaetales bacterium]|nr:AAA family ATPase [Spirochaetales bacterium]
MHFSHIKIRNWKNFKSAEAALTERVFIIGANAAGKSNFLDAFRFLKDIARTGGGLQEAVNKERGGLSKIRCLAARAPNTDVEIEVSVADDSGRELYRYKLAISQQGKGARGGNGGGSVAILKKEEVHAGSNLVLERPNAADKDDPTLLQYTHLEQPTVNGPFRELVEFFQSIEYLHVVPQLIRSPESFQSTGGQDDYFGRGLIEKIQKKNLRTRDSFLRRINEALSKLLPHFEDLQIEKDEMGLPHLIVRYKHWRDKGARQNERQFSDGTLRFIGLFWALQDGNKPILLEEPELSLHSSVIAWLPEIIAKMQKKKDAGLRQVILSTHSFELLRSPTIGMAEVLLLVPGSEATEIKQASDFSEIKAMVDSGFSLAESAIPLTNPGDIEKMVTGIK